MFTHQNGTDFSRYQALNPHFNQPLTKETNPHINHEHPPASFGDDHLRTQLVEFGPQLLGFQATLDIGQFLTPRTGDLQYPVPSPGACSTRGRRGGRGGGRAAPTTRDRL